MMHIESADADLQDLLLQLARYFSANETRISVAEASTCFLRLSLIDSTALVRLFLLLCPSFQSVLSQQGKPSETSTTTTNRPESSNRARGLPRSPPSPPESSTQSNSESDNAFNADGCCQSKNPTSTNDETRPTSQPGHIVDATVSQAIGGVENLNIPGPSIPEQTSLSQQCSLVELAPPILGELTVHPSDTTGHSPTSSDDAVDKTRLASCNDVAFTPTLRQLLEDCKTDRGLFLRKVEESQAALPNGQGWQAAIATKQDNADMRDLLSIYHRFECYNIYRHVVDAGYHTGEHWIRDKRQELTKKLCDDFPERFENAKAANKCLNWVDQGCKYHEWTKAFGEEQELGFLVALPSEIPRSSYTSRCTKEQMSAAAMRFTALGICELVKSLELSELGNHIAQRLKDMTTRQRHCTDAPERHIHRSCKPPGLMPSLGTPAILPSDQSTPRTAVTLCDDIEMMDDTTFMSEFMLPDDTWNNYQLSCSTYLDHFMDSQLTAFTLPLEEWYPTCMDIESQNVS